MEWIDPRYADLVAWYRQQDDEPDLAPYGLPLRRVDGESVSPRRGFVMEPFLNE